jgi:hypothetical protein
MRKAHLFRNGAIGIGFFILFSAAAGCSKSNNNTNNQKVNYTLSGNANGAQEVPAVTTTATGTLAGTYNSSTNALTYTISWSDLSSAPILMHFHGPALAGENASPSLGITGFPTTVSGTFSGSATLTDTQEADLLAGKWYYNIHTTEHGGGEIRGQVAVQ